MGLFIGANYS